MDSHLAGIAGRPAVRQSRSKSRVGFVIGSCCAWRSASSKRRDSASPRVLLRVDRLLEDRLAPGGFLREDALRVAQLGLVAALGLLCETTRPRLVSMTSVDWQHGHVTSSSDLSRAMLRVPPTCHSDRAPAERTIIA